MKLFHFQCKGYIFRENGCFLVFVGSAFFKKVESRKVEKSKSRVDFWRLDLKSRSRFLATDFEHYLRLTWKSEAYYFVRGWCLVEGNPDHVRFVFKAFGSVCGVVGQKHVCHVRTHGEMWKPWYHPLLLYSKVKRPLSISLFQVSGRDATQRICTGSTSTIMNFWFAYYRVKNC